MSVEPSEKNETKLSLGDYVKVLEAKLEQLVFENKSLEYKYNKLLMDFEKLQRQVEYYKSQIEKLITPPLIEATVVDVLKDGRVIVRSSTGPNLVVQALDSIDLSLLRPGARVALNQRGSAVVEALPESEDPLVKSMEIVERPNVKYSDVGGLSEQIMELREVIELPLKKPELFKEIGVEPPKGILLYGPPGCGKTLLAKAVASEAEAAFISIVGSELVQKFIGEGARIVRELFQLARRKAPAIVFIDELDSIASRRIDIGTSGEREVQRTLMQLLAEIDGFKPLDGVKIIAATNRVDILDPAILRPGRLDRLIEIPPPNLSGRIEIFKIHTKRMKLANDVNLEELAKVTEGLCGAEIKAICTEAGYFAIRSGRNVVSMNDFINAVKKTLAKRDVRGRPKEMEQGLLNVYQ